VRGLNKEPRKPGNGRKSQRRHFFWVFSWLPGFLIILLTSATGSPNVPILQEAQWSALSSPTRPGDVAGEATARRLRLTRGTMGANLRIAGLALGGAEAGAVTVVVVTVLEQEGFKTGQRAR
jgi:hypothetical protein